MSHNVVLVKATAQVSELIRPAAAAKRLHVELTIEDPGIELVADADRLQQVIWNLLSKFPSWPNRAPRFPRPATSSKACTCSSSTY